MADRGRAGQDRSGAECPEGRALAVHHVGADRHQGGAFLKGQSVHYRDGNEIVQRVPDLKGNVG